VMLAASGSVSNTGTIAGGAGGSGGAGGAGGQGSVDNGANGKNGAAGVAGDGVLLAAGGVVINGSASVHSALIEGLVGVYAGPGGAATVTSYGEIQGTGGTAVQLMSASDRLIVESGSAWVGAARGGGGTLELAGGTGTITGLGATGTLSGAEAMTFGGFVAYAIDAGSSWTLSGTNTVGADGSLTVAGTLANAGALAGGVTLTSAGARLIVGTGSSITGLAAGDGGTLELAAVGVTLTGLGGSGTLSGGVSADFTGFGYFLVDGGATLTGTNALGSGQALAATGTIDNAGTLSVDGAAAFAELLAGAPGATLTGYGAVVLNAKGVIDGATTGASLTNVDDTIAGDGFIEGLASLTNDGGGVIDATGGRMLINLAGATVINNGLIEATTPTGILLVNHTTIDSSGGGTVEAGGQIQLNEATLLGGALTIDKGGLLISKTAAGVVNLEGGTVDSAGTLEGAGGGLTVDGDVANSGLILAENGALKITGNVSGTGRGEVVGSGVLELGGTFGQAVSLATGATGGLVLDASAVFSGAISGGGVSNVTNDGLIETGSAATLVLKGVNIDDAGGGAIEVGKELLLEGATITGGALTIVAGGRITTSAKADTIDLGGATVSNAGTLEGAGGGLIVDGDVADSGLVIAENGALTITGAVTGTGKIEMFGKGTLEIDGEQGGTIAFGSGSTGRLVLGDSADFSGTITGFSKTGANSIDLEDIDFADGPTATYVANKNANSGGVLTVSDGTRTATIKLTGANYGASANFALRQDGGTGTVVVDPSPHAFAAAMAGFVPTTSATKLAVSGGGFLKPPILATPA